MSTTPVKVLPTNLKEHACVRDALRVVKNSKVCIYRNGLLKGLMNGTWSVIPSTSTLRSGSVGGGCRVYYIHSPIKAETDSEVFEITEFDQVPLEAWQSDQSDYLILRVVV